MRVVEVEENHDNEHRETTATNTNYNYRESLLSSITDMELPVLSFFDVISVMRCLMGLLVQFLAYFVMSFNTPLISNHLDQSGYSPIFMGASMITASVCYIVSMPLTSSLKKRMSKKGVLFIGLSLQSIGVMISGIDQIENWYNPGFFSLFGISCIGLGTGCAMIPIMPEILEGIEERFQNNYDEITLHNNMAGYFICCQALGETLGPLISSVLERSIEFRPTQKLLGVLVCGFLVIYLVSCGFQNFFTYKPPKSK
jgi:MFS family permease